MYTTQPIYTKYTDPIIWYAWVTPREVLWSVRKAAAWGKCWV